MTRLEMRQGLERLTYSILFLISTVPHQFLNTMRGNEHTPITVLDQALPVVSIFAVPYLFWFLFIGMMLVVFAFSYEDDYYRLVNSLIVGTVISTLIFYFYPTVIARPGIPGTDPFSAMVRFIYSVDNPFDCLPSLHILYALLPTFFFCKCSKSSFWKTATVITFVLICLSTVFIKQHYVMDVLIASAIGSVLYIVFATDLLANALEFTGALIRPVKRVSEDQ